MSDKDKHPPHITVQHYTKEQRQAGLVPSVVKDQGPDAQIFQANTAPPPASNSPGIGETIPDSNSQTPPFGEIDQSGIESPTIDTGDVMVKGLAAITMAEMLELGHLWDIRTGEVISIQQAKRIPEYAVVDFSALKSSLEGIDEQDLTALVGAIPERLAQEANERSKRIYQGPPAGPGVTVRQIPGIVRVEVDGPVKLQKSRQGNVRILQVQYAQVQAPTGAAKASRVIAGPSAVSPGQTHKVHMRNVPKPLTRTVPRQPTEELPDTEPDIIDEDSF